MRKINDVGFSVTNGTWYSVEKRIINKSKKALDKTLHEKMNRINEAYSMIREGRYDLDPGEEWYREQYKEASRKDSILYHPLFRRVVLIGIAVSMFVVGIAAAFFSALRV